MKFSSSDWVQQAKRISVVALVLGVNWANADDLNAGDTAWILTSTALVLFMTIPGLSLFYAG